MDFHEIANVFPLMAGREFDELIADIRDHGLREDIVTYEGKILDGRNRYRACQEAGVPASMVRWEDIKGEDDDPVRWVVSKNIHRRHLSETQRANVATKLATLKKGNPMGSNQHERKSVNLPISSQAEAAELMNVSVSSVGKARRIRENAAPEIVEAMDQNEVSLNDAVSVIDLSEEEQVQALKEKKEGKVKTMAEAVKKRRPVNEKKAALKKEICKLLDTVEEKIEQLSVSVLARSRSKIGSIRDDVRLLAV